MALVDDIVKAIQQLGGTASLKDIYKTVKPMIKPGEHHWQDNYSYEVSIRRCIEFNSRDSAVFGGEDLFIHLDRGVWGLFNIKDLMKARLIQGDQLIHFIDLGFDEYLGVGKTHLYFKHSDHKEYPTLIIAQKSTMIIQIHPNEYYISFNDLLGRPFEILVQSLENGLIEIVSSIIQKK